MPIIQKSFLLAWQVASQLAYMVIIPIFIFGGIGLWLDFNYKSSPICLLVGIGIALAVTLFWIIKKFKQINLTNLEK